MRIRNTSPFVTAAIVTSRRPPTPEMVVVVRGTFTLVPNGSCELVGDLLAQGPLKAETFGDDDRENALLYPGDFAPFKPKVDVLLSGTCHTPHGLPLRECGVELSVGPLRKRLRVVGTRRWLDARTLSEPLPFSEQALDWSRASRTEHNPIGADIPNVEHPEFPRRRQDEPQFAANFGAVHPDWPARKQHWGKAWGEDYQKTRAPFFAADFDFRACQAAPHDQQLDALAVDAELKLINLDPVHASLKTRLPGLFPRAYVKSREHGAREVLMRLDTVFIEAEQRRVTLTWRGHCEVREEDLSDVSSLLVAGASLEEPGDREAHLAELEAFDRDPVGLEAGMAEALAEVAKDAEALGKKDEELAADLSKTFGGGKAGDAVADVLARALAAGKQGVDLRALISEAQKSNQSPAGAAPAGTIPAAAKLPITQAFERAARKTQDENAKRELAKAQLMLGKANEHRAELVPFADLSGRDLAGWNLSGFDLRGVNLREANLQATKLTGANLAGADLTGACLCLADASEANLDGATLTTVDATGASFVSASLKNIRFDRSTWDEANLSFADLTGAQAEQALLTRAVLRGATLAKVRFVAVDFQESDLSSATLIGADLERCFFFRSQLSHANLSDARLEKTAFSEAQLGGARFVGAHGEASVWLGAMLSETDFSFAELPCALFDGANLKQARLFGADLRAARFLRACLDRASFERANLFEADLRRCSVHGTAFIHANLFGAAVHGMKGESVRFDGANVERLTGGGV